MNAPDTASFGLRRDLPRARQLVTPGRLAALAAQTYLLFEVGYGALAQCERAHIGGAGYIDTSELEGGPLWNKVDDAALLRVLLAHGIRADSTVILYGRNNLAAARAAHLLLYAGVLDVRLLDGGYTAWVEAGLPCVQGPPRRDRSAASFGAVFPGRPDYLCGMAQARAVLQGAGGALVSIRTWNEFIGATSGYSYIAAAGDIPGARWGRAGADGNVDSMADFQDAQGRMKPAADIARMWQASGIHGGQPAVFYCGTGWRAALAFYYAWLMGWENIAVFDGGWCEWSRDAGNPVLCRIAAPNS